MASLILILPLFSALLGYVFRLKIAVCFFMFLLSFFSFYLFIENKEEIITILKFLPMVNYSLRLDKLSLTLTFMVSFISATTSFYTLGYIKDTERQIRLLRLNALFTCFIIYFICSDNLFSLCTGYGMATVSGFFILSFYDMKTTLGNVAAKVMSFNFIGYAILLVITALLYNRTGSYNFSVILNELYTENSKSLTYLLAFCAFIMSAIYGFHNWLIKANKTSGISLIFLYSGIFVSLGLFLFGRFYLIFENNPKITDFIILYCSISSIILSFYATTQSDLKKIALLSVCSQISLIFIIFLNGNLSIFTYAIMYHGFFKTLLFMAFGTIICIASNEYNLFKLGGLFKLTKITFFISLIACIFTVSFPMIISQIDFIGDLIFVKTTLTINSFLTAFYLTKVLLLVFFTEFKGEETVYARIKEANPILLISLLLMLIASVITGVFFLKYINFNYNCLYQIMAILAGGIISYHHNLKIVLKDVKNDTITDETKVNAIHRLLANWLFYKPSYFCYNIIEELLLSNLFKKITCFSLYSFKKIKEAKESDLFIYNLWIIIGVVICILYTLGRG